MTNVSGIVILSSSERDFNLEITWFPQVQEAKMCQSLLLCAMVPFQLGNMAATVPANQLPRHKNFAGGSDSDPHRHSARGNFRPKLKHVILRG